MRAEARAAEQWRAGNRPVPVRVSDGRLIYAVRSRSYGPACPHCGVILPPAPAVYIVEPRPDGSLTCDCPAGEHDGVCWHKAAVERRLAREGALT